MFKKLFYFVLLFATLLSASEINWAKDYQSGIKDAIEQNKPVLFVFSNHACKYCIMLDTTTFKNSKVIEALNRDFISIISYTDEKDYTPEVLWRPGTPTIWFLFSNGEPIFEPLMGAVDAENFLNALAIVKEEFDNTKNTEK